MASAVACWRAALVAGLFAFAACTSPDASKVCSFNGESYLCPSDTECGAAQRLCVKSGGCGNGTVDEGEQCDDGNKLPGDGCSPTCQREECGNGTLDLHEICDDGNTKGGDGCSADCKSREACGNGIIDRDAGEICDDGVIDGKDGVTPPRSGDGCSADCRSTEVCGNHITDTAVGEVCDDGPLGSVACSANCRSNLSCGNRAVDPGEECDRGHLAVDNPHGNDDANDCRADCQFNRCGDGVIDTEPGSRFEQCDDGHLNHLNPIPAETANCNIDCTSPHCGDGKVNRAAGEQCDDGANLADDGCSPSCKFERCGNNIVDPQEQCDGVAGPQPCNLATCFLELCGNGTRDDDNRTGIHEQCDDHNTNDDDGCSHDCKIESCGDGKKNDGEACDPTDPAFGAAGCNSDCTLPVCGDKKLNTAAGEQCDDGNTIPGDGCSATCQNERCGNGVLDPHEQCDGLLGLQPCNNATCVREVCGNGVLDQDAGHSVHEQCDDGNADPNDGCSAICQIEFCGNSATDNHEACDPSDVAFGAAGCNSDCTLPVCGDSKLNTAAGEQCDDGNTIPGDGCSATCQNERCGNGVLDPHEQCDGLLGLQPCNNATCVREVCGNGVLDQDAGHSVHEQCDDGNADPNDGCSAICQIEFCGNSATDNHEACDPSDVAFGAAGCNSDCTLPVCGDSKLNTAAGEQCDDGNIIPGDGCSATCQNERCGNGVLDPHEQCDGILGLQPCNNATCVREVCGNGILDQDAAHSVHEQCDDGNTDPNDGCSPTCQFEFCGNGVTDNHEACDPSDVAFGAAGCNTDCTLPVCGDSKLNTAAGEQCDDGNIIPGDGCSATCQNERCGNGVLDPHEQCDGILGLQPCNNATCVREVCGNGILDQDAAHSVHEQCDDGNTDPNDGCSPTCQFEFCGNGVTDNHEACDPSDPAFGAAGCNTDCTLPVCGDSKLNTAAGEQCDDGNIIPGDGCSATCRNERCGNGVLDPHEQCDGILGLQPCNNATCVREVCGNGILDQDAGHSVHEQCDDGNTDPNDGCSPTCLFEFCGNGATDNHEACDPSDPAFGAAGCNTDCTLPVCGDSKLNTAAGEQCDDGNIIPGDGCSATCLNERCGNGILDPHEQCDGVLGLQPCNTTTCVQEVCGNGILDQDLANSVLEQCDDGNTDANDGCSPTCQFEFCGNGATDNHEACDPSDPAFGAAGCNTDCTLPACGDSKLNTAAGEQCDDGNIIPGDGCSATCLNERCGNGILDPHEQCDGVLGLQPCNTATCVAEICGNGILDQDAGHGVNEQCDDGNTDAHDGCSPTCQFETCGNGVADPGEQCDSGGANTDTPSCAYDATCTSCTTGCRIVTLNPHCGDGAVDAPDEVCDDGNADACGSCNATCGRVTSQQAFGFIVAAAGSQLDDGDTFTLDDGITPPTVFEFQFTGGAFSGLTSADVLISFDGTETAAQMGQAIASAIVQRHADGLLLIAPVVDPNNTNDALVLLRHDRFTALGNQPITASVATPAFVTAGLAGGLGGDCDDGTGCTRDADCASNVCDTSSHTCTTPDVLHLASRTR